MVITARLTCTKNATYIKTAAGKPSQSLARQIVRYYDVSGTSMVAIGKTSLAVKAYLEQALSVADQYPTVAKDPEVTEWKEEPWVISW